MTKDVREAIMLFFDDDYASAYTEAFAYMQQYNMVGTLHIVSNLVGTGGRITVPQMQEMYAAGWKMTNHTASHWDPSLHTRAENAADLATCRDALRSWGFADGALHCAYSGGGTYTADADAALADVQARTAGPPSHNGVWGLDTFFPASGTSIILPITSITGVYFWPSGGYTEAQAETNVTSWMASSKIIGYHIFHDIVASGATGINVNRADFRKYIDFLHTQGYRFITLPDFWALHAPKDKYCIP